MSDAYFPEIPEVSVNAWAAWARREFYKILPTFAHLPEWEGLTADFDPAGYSERAMRMWATIVRAQRMYPEISDENIIKSAWWGLLHIRAAGRLASAPRDLLPDYGALLDTLPRLDLVDALMLREMHPEDQEMLRLPARQVAEYLVRNAAELGAFPHAKTAPMTTTTTTFFLHPVTPPWDNQMELFIWQVMDPLRLPDITQQLAARWLSKDEADRFRSGLSDRQLVARLVRLAAIHIARAEDGRIRDPSKLATTGAWLLNLGCALDLPDSDEDVKAPVPVRVVWRNEMDGVLLARLGKYAPGYQLTTAEAVAVIAEWCEKQRMGPWEPSAGWTPGGAWVYPDHS
jgi:hypothetical protein